MAKSSPNSIPLLPLSEAPIEGRLDVVAYRVSERLVRALDIKLGMGGALWGQVSRLVEDIIRENIPDEKLGIPEEVRTIVNILRKNGVGI